jgi:hypothetical protein
MVTVNQIAYLQQELISLVDQGKGDSPITEVCRRLKAGDIWEWINRCWPDTIDLGDGKVISHADARGITEAMRRLVEAGAAPPGPWGVKRNGLCLLVALLAELLTGIRLEDREYIPATVGF